MGYIDRAGTTPKEIIEEEDKILPRIWSFDCLSLNSVKNSSNFLTDKVTRKIPRNYLGIKSELQQSQKWCNIDSFLPLFLYCQDVLEKADLDDNSHAVHS